MGKRRSRGITIFGWIFIIFSILGLLDFGRRPGLLNDFWLIYSFLTAALNLVAGIFILRLREWARRLVIIVRILAIINTVTSWLSALHWAQTKEFTPVTLYLSFFFYIVWSVVVIFFFTRPQVREQFVKVVK